MDVRQLGLSEDDLAALGYRVPKRDNPAEPPTETATPSLRREGPGVRAWLWTLGTLFAVGWIARPSERLPNPVPANQPDTVFSSARAMSQLVDIAKAPRPVGSSEHARVRDHLSERLTALGLEVEVQEHPVTVAVEGGAVVTTVRNVVGRHAGTASTGTLVVTAHYDGPPLSPAAADNALGLSAILETVRAVAAGPSLRNDVVFVLSDAKELGSLGIAAFLDHHPWAANVRAGATVDALGGSGVVAWRSLDAGKGVVTQAALKRLNGPGAYSVLDGMADDPAFDGESASFEARGIPSLGLVALGGRAAHGGPLDRPIAVREATLQHAGAQLLGFVRTFGFADLGRQAEVPARSYVALPLGLVVHYSTGSGTLFAAGVALAFVLAFVLVRLRGGRWPGILAGSALGVLAIALGAGLGSVATAFLPSFHAEAEHLEVAVFEGGLYALTLLALVVAGLSGSYAMVRRRYPARELVLGALVPPFAVTVAVTFVAPSAQSVVQPAFALGLVALLGLVLTPIHGGTGSRLAALVPVAGVLLFVVPGLSLLTDVLTLSGARALGAWMALAALLCLPAVEWLLRPRSWALPALGGLAALVTLVVSSPRFADAGDHPQLTSLALLVDDTVSVGGTPQPSRWRSSRWLTVAGAGSGWAGTWVVDATGAGAETGDLGLPRASEWIVAGVGPEAFIPPPTIGATHEVDDGVHRIDLEIVSGMEAEMVVVRLPDDFPGDLESAEGLELPTSPEAGVPRTVRFWGTGTERARHVTIQLHDAPSANSERLVLEVLEHHLRPREILGEDFFQRADSVMADPSTGSDRLVQRVQVHIPASEQNPGP